ncbi:FAD-dependent oxidoreductase [Rhodoplanes sp. Z2-YC6860]|uniref:FAD-dependent oxidoreductase n=1 Tax=Rhodoplanes sp. Z2-YC6860 TaxID=674703 RepID=UPI00078CB5D6|nr:FAD-dependent oxidoreductase [Rhodoplanes sp. Z2-YC6860]AMN44198.1 glycine/D-amino acid oxidase, deaminating [Rhodoplanes sp. Z2-YC6860]
MNVNDERTRSLWASHGTLAPNARRLSKDVTCDVAVVGAGIAGLSVAYELSHAGKKVVVLDRGAIGGGMTSRTTAHLAPICDDGVAALAKMRGEEMAAKFQASQAAAVDRIEAIVKRHAIDCDFRRLEAFLFPAPGMEFKEAREQQDEEYKALRAANVEVKKDKGVKLKGYEDAPVLRYANQATFHPLEYLAGLIAQIEAEGGRLFRDSPVMEVEETDAHVRLKLEGGMSVTAQHAVFATNSPTCDWVDIHSKMAPYRTYAMAFELPRGTLPDALYWDMADPYHYVRIQPGAGSSDILIAGGADHKSGEADDGDVRFQAIEAWIRELIPKLGEEKARWSGQVMDTIDYCGFIGRDPSRKRTFIATGDSGQGMTHGALAGILLKNLVIYGAGEWSDVYEPSRKPVSAVANFINENVTAIKNFAEYLMPSEIESAESLKPGQGGVLRSGTSKVAVCRTLDGTLHSRSAVCTHLGCHVHWNSTEQCWDCPCHGSQFGPDGDVLNGPAIAPLAEIKKTVSEAAE